MAGKLYSFKAGNKIAALNLDNLRIANNALFTCLVLMYFSVLGIVWIYFTSSWKISNGYRPISGIRYMIHDHESSFAGIWERIMREE